MPVKYKRYFAFLIISAFLFGLRIYLLWETPLYDYDSIKNFIIAREIFAGDFSDLFQRRIPTIHLINTVVYGITKSAVGLIFFHALVSTLAITGFLFWWAKKERYQLSDTVWLCLIAGSSPLLVNLSRYMSIESFTLVFFLGFIRYYLEWLEKREQKQLIYASIIYAIGTTVNYKFLFLLPIFIGFEWVLSRKYISWRTAFSIGLIFISPFAFYSFLGLLLEVGPLKYIIVQFSTIFSAQHNPLHAGGTFDFDWLFYFRYILNFQNPVVLIALLWIVWTYRSTWKPFIHKPLPLQFLILFTLVYFLIILFIRKAPRGLLFIDPFLSYFFFISLLGYIKRKWVLYSIFLLSLSFNLLKINQTIYPYAHTSYPNMAEVIKKENISKLLLSTGLGVVPYLSEEIHWKVIFNDHELIELKKQGYTHILMDDYRIITGMKDFHALDNAIPIYSVQEISLHAPILALEHAEFVRIGYKEAMQLSKEVKERPANLILLKLD